MKTPLLPDPRANAAALPAWRTAWDADCAAAEDVSANPDTICARVFALPLLIVAGARARAMVPGVLPDAGAVSLLLAEKGVLGATRNFGLCASLVPLDAVDRVTPAHVRDWTAGGIDAVPRDFVGAPIAVDPGREQVHLRFLIGAGITPAGAPSFLETASNIGAWGMPLTQLLARALRTPGVDLLPMPRPPLALLRAGHAGRSAQLAAAFDLFLSNALRRFRMAVGEPTAVVSAHALPDGGGELRVSLHTVLDASLLEGYAWPLHPLDDVSRIAGEIAAALQQCRVHDVRWFDSVLPDELPRGMRFFAAGADPRAAGLH